MNLSHIAIHEAGHAVAHYRLRLELGYVSIVAQGKNAGAVTGAGVYHVHNRMDAKKQVIAYLAGYAALVARGYDEETALQGTGSDMECVSELFELWNLNDLDKWKSLAVKMMSRPKNIAAIDRLARELETRQKFDSDMAMVFIEVADGDSTEDELERYLIRQQHFQ